MQCESDEGSLSVALREYFHRVHKHTTIFRKSGLNKRRIVQFGLACVYLHRTGLAVKGLQLFKKIKGMSLLPRTHALMKKKIKVNSITRNEVLIKDIIKKNTGSGGQSLGDWAFPAF